MPKWNDPHYHGRGQSLIKHILLEKYLERFSYVIGTAWDEITYVDCFSGPWNAKSNDLVDASFAIALNQLCCTRDAILNRTGKKLRVRCLFLEKDPEAFKKLDAYAREHSGKNDVLVAALNTEFEAAIPEIQQFVTNSSSNGFRFIFIDPKGWKGFSLSVIGPLLQLPYCEVLINFMTSFIVRFAETENLSLIETFTKLFGDDTYRHRLADLDGEQREDALVFAYADAILKAGNFLHTAVTVVPNPEKDRTHYHLIFATRHLKGIEVFKDAEREVVKQLDYIRTDAKLRRGEIITGQSDLFGAEHLQEGSFVEALKSRYAYQSKAVVVSLIKERKSLSYDEVYSAAMRFPFVEIADLRGWLKQYAQIEGLTGRETVPKIGKCHVVKLKNL